MSTMPDQTLIPDQTVEEDTTDDQSWFWTEEWQQGYREALDDLEQGRYKEFDNVEDLIREIKR